ncbi:MAG: ABC transporter ATP-binding protein [Anaerolineaceae bacterium]|nr:ABC transporter ATP-binding protein [Anaerolineaceae bacterium]
MQLNNDELIRISNLKVTFPLDEGLVQALDGIDLSIKKSKVIGVVGESGCGKSITARSILRIIPPPGRIDEGEILLRTNIGTPNGEEQIIDLAQIDEESEQLRQIRGHQISMIFQEPMTSFSSYHTIGDQISEAAIVHQISDKHKARELAIQMLDRVGIPNASTRISQYPHEFSGGMRQRAMIAMAMICNPSLLIADEPTTSLDVTIQAQMLELMRDLRTDFNSSILFITHNLGVIAQIADEVYIMYLGKIVEHGTVDDIFHNPKHPYTVNLLQAIPKITGTTKDRLVAIEGSVPSPFERPSGCPFHPRCDRIIKGVCESKIPSVTDITNNHQVSCNLYT